MPAAVARIAGRTGMRARMRLGGGVGGDGDDGRRSRCWLLVLCGDGKHFYFFLLLFFLWKILCAESKAVYKNRAINSQLMVLISPDLSPPSCKQEAMPVKKHPRRKTRQRHDGKRNEKPFANAPAAWGNPRNDEHQGGMRNTFSPTDWYLAGQSAPDTSERPPASTPHPAFAEREKNFAIGYDRWERNSTMIPSASPPPLYKLTTSSRN